MYDTLTAVYGATFHKTISPLSGQWRTEDHREALCNDPILMGAMESLKFQYIRVCESLVPENQHLLSNLIDSRYGRRIRA
jgi:hypothetical protein